MIPDFTAGFTFDAFIVLQEALRYINGELTSNNLREAIEKVIMCGSTGCRQYTANDHSGLSATSLIPVQDINGKWQTFQKYAPSENFGFNYILAKAKKEDIDLGRELTLNNCAPCHFGSNRSDTVLIEKPARTFEEIADDPAVNNLTIVILVTYMNSSVMHAGGMPYLSLTNDQVYNIASFISSLNSKAKKNN
jgi:mono/diheme cytochrome c family protein